MYFGGDGVIPDRQTAIKWYSLAAEHGHIGTQTYLGQIYNNGWDVAQDYKVAFKWFRKAAEQGGTEAQAVLSKLYEEGLGVPQDYTRAHMWWTISESREQGEIEQMMTAAQIEKTQKLTQECVVKNYKDC